MPRKDSELEFVGFRVEEDLDATLEDLAWENRISKSELLRQFCRHGVEHADEILDEVEGDVDARSSQSDN